MCKKLKDLCWKWLGVIVVCISTAILLLAGFQFGLTYAHNHPQPIITPGGDTVELRYNPHTHWFQLYENGILRAEYTATQLNLDYVPNPKGWKP